jgi:hypothetical protein
MYIFNITPFKSVLVFLNPRTSILSHRVTKVQVLVYHVIFFQTYELLIFLDCYDDEEYNPFYDKCVCDTDAAFKVRTCDT